MCAVPKLARLVGAGLAGAAVPGRQSLIDLDDGKRRHESGARSRTPLAGAVGTGRRIQSLRAFRRAVWEVIFCGGRGQGSGVRGQGVRDGKEVPESPGMEPEWSRNEPGCSKMESWAERSPKKKVQLAKREYPFR